MALLQDGGIIQLFNSWMLGALSGRAPEIMHHDVVTLKLQFLRQGQSCRFFDDISIRLIRHAKDGTTFVGHNQRS